MTKYTKCPICDLNYITAGEQHCKLCDPKMAGQTLTDMEIQREQQRLAKLQAYTKRKQSMEDYKAIRYNQTPKRI